MRHTTRHIEARLTKAARNFPALVLTGPRRSGKTTLLRHLFPKAQYWLLEDPDTVDRIRSDPRDFMEQLRPPVILDEIQNTPELFGYLRTRIDRTPRRTGQWLITGSQEAPLMRGVSESMAGRAAIFQLLPFSTLETPKVSLRRGGFPEVVARPSAANDWFRSYVQTYLERDVRAVTAVSDLLTFRRFVALLASRCGTMLNRTELAGPLGITVPTVSSWLSILEITGQIMLVPPYFENFGKRLVKSPKVYFVDSGLACFLLGLDSDRILSRSPFHGPVFEGLVASEIVKHQVNSGKPRALYYFRDQQGLEVDFIVPMSGSKALLVEAKAGRTVRPDDAKQLIRLRKAMGPKARAARVVYNPTKDALPATISPGVKAGSIGELLADL